MTVRNSNEAHMILAGGGGESVTRPITMSSSIVYLKVRYSPSSLERTASRTADHCWALDLIPYQEVFLKNGNSGAAARKEERAVET